MRKPQVLMAVILPAIFSLTLTPAAVGAQSSQGTQPKAIYRVEYLIRELENGKVANTRNYIVMVEISQGERKWGRFRAGNDVPFVTEAVGNTGSAKIQYKDVGISVMCSIFGSEGALTLETSFNSSAAVQARTVLGADAPEGNPVFRTISLDDQAPIELGKQVLVGRVDDVATNRTYEIEAIVTKAR
jgi:hypothetical protein